VLPPELHRTSSSPVPYSRQHLVVLGAYSWLLVRMKGTELAKVGVEGSSPFARSIFPRSVRFDRDGPPFVLALSSAVDVQ